MNENEYRDYYEAPKQEEPMQPQYYQPGNTAGRSGSPWGYIATALISVVVGALLAILFIPNTGLYYDTEYYSTQQSYSSSLFPFFDLKPGTEDDVYATAEPTPKPTERPQPSYDGTLPVIEEGTSNPIPDIVEQVSAGIIGVNGYVYSTYYKSEIAGSLGSGFFISSEGYILTCAHVVEGTDSVTVTLADGTEVEAEIMGMDKTLDIAVLKVDPTGLDITVLAFGDSDTIRVGEFVIAIGDPTGRELAGTTTFGIISATKRSVNIDGIVNNYIQTDAAVNPGSSGGVLLNMAGEVIGIISAKTVTADYDEYGNAIAAEGLGFAIPINEAIEVANLLITKGYIERPGLGISVIEMDEASAESYDVVPGVMVYSVTKGGSADLAGLKVYDVILSCDGREMGQDALVAYIKSKMVGDVITLEVWRNGETFTLEVELINLNDLGSETTTTDDGDDSGSDSDDKDNKYY